MKRRELLNQIGLTVGAMTLGSPAVVSAETPGNKRKRVLRIAHITDVHIRPDENAPARFRKCLEEIKKHRVDFFLNGGDSIFAADYNDITRERVNELWKLWHDCKQTINEFEMHSCLGNHDMWWAASDKEDTMYGKNYVVKQLGIPHRYYSFNKKNWHFVVLDSNNKNAGSLDEEQRMWLEKDLENLSPQTPVICLSHYPILAVCTHVVGGNHTDSSYITDLFYKHRDKKINCLSGHIHLRDDADYNGVKYFCNGSMSGFWWGEGDKESAGKYFYKQTPPGYAILDLFDDGYVKNEYFQHSY
jgi:3',5'-cyclic AMP phosphodiesterase CpdA